MYSIAPLWPILLATFACTTDVDDSGAQHHTTTPQHDQTWVDINMSTRFGCALDGEGYARCSGSEEEDNPRGEEPDTPLSEIASSHFLVACGLDSYGVTQCFGDPGGYELAMSIADAPSDPMRRLAAGQVTMCGIRSSDGLPDCWGGEQAGWTSDEPTIALSNIALARAGSCGISIDDGSMICWGDRDSSVISTPPDGVFTHLDIGYEVGVAITDRGSLAFWGNDEYGATDLSGGFGVDDLPEGEFVQVAVGHWFEGWHPAVDADSVSSAHACAIEQSAEIVCWGDGRFGATDPPSLGPGWTDVDAQGLGSCGIHSGKIYCWGTFYPDAVLPPDL